jgi:hypothetical protein
MYCLFCVVLCIVCVCIYVLNYWHRVAIQLQLNIYDIISTLQCPYVATWASCDMNCISALLFTVFGTNRCCRV